MLQKFPIVKTPMLVQTCRCTRTSFGAVFRLSICINLPSINRCRLDEVYRARHPKAPRTESSQNSKSSGSRRENFRSFHGGGLKPATFGKGEGHFGAGRRHGTRGSPRSCRPADHGSNALEDRPEFPTSVDPTTRILNRLLRSSTEEDFYA